MKKFLTVLLVVSVLFTFSFSSAFAATYTVEDYVKALSGDLEDVVDYLKSVKKQAVKVPAYDEDGFATTEYPGYAKAAFEAAIDAFIADVEDELDDAIDAYIEGSFDKATAPKDLKELDGVTDYTTYNAEALLDAAMAEDANLADANEANAPEVKKYVEAEAAEIDPADYSDKAEDRFDKGSYTDITPREYVEAVIDEFEDALVDAEKEYKATNAKRFEAYLDALEALEDAMVGLETLEDAEIADKEEVKDVAGEVNDYVASLYEFYSAKKFAAGESVEEDSEKGILFKKFIDAKKETVFGVKVADFAKLTKKEAAAINDAFYDVVKTAEDVVEAACDSEDDVDALVAQDPEVVLYNTTKAAEVYEDVVAYGAKLKKAYFLGEKQYDDAKVDAIVKAAEELVYADLGAAGFKSAEYYFDKAASEEDINPVIETGKYADFLEARDEAIEKMYAEENVPAKSVKYGADKTPDADYVYLVETYAYEEDWADIAEDAVNALVEAQSYEEIEAIMADAAADFGKLVKADEVDLSEVEEAKGKYSDALADYIREQKDLVDLDDYTMGQFGAALNEGRELIADAKTVAEVKEAYAEAKALVAGLLTDDEIEAAEKEVKKAINALPYTAKLTAADKDAVVAAIEAYQEYSDILALTKDELVTKKAELYDKAAVVFAEIFEDMEEAQADFADDVEDAIEEMGTDAGMDAFLALKGDVEEMVAAADEYEDLLDDLDIDCTDICLYNADYDFLAGLLAVDFDYINYQEVTFWGAEIEDAELALIQASKASASIAEMQAAKEAYKALTEKQQLYLADDLIMNGYGLEMLYVIDGRLTNTVETLKITARSSAKKGSITVKWDVEGDTACVEAYEIWKSTKHSSGYKKAFTTTKMSYKNTKGLEKGTRYYYKVRAIAYDMDGDKVKSDWSNKARRIAK